MRCIRRALCIFALLVTAIRPLSGQSGGRAFAGSALGAAAGALVGGVAGAYIGGNRCVDDANPDSCYLIAGTAIGLGVGVTLGAPVGAHLLNRRQGNLTTSLLASTAIGVFGMAAFRYVDLNVRGSSRGSSLNTILVVVPLAQIVSAGLIESRTGRR